MKTPPACANAFATQETQELSPDDLARVQGGAVWCILFQDGSSMCVPIDPPEPPGLGNLSDLNAP
ncbi:MAG: hypothetical protein IPG50_34070 [Myxococcales bacterium]|nr:hypothetical protein [Myxococcales bacterium]